MNKKQKEENINPFMQKNNETEEKTSTQENEDKVEETTSDNDDVEKLKLELDDLNNKYLRLAADFDNYRKRQAQERESLLKYGAQETLTQLINVLDTFERAKENNDKTEDCTAIINNYNVAIKQFEDILTKCGLEKIETVNQKFNPNYHEAISQTPTNDVEEDTIVAEMRAGYKLKDKVLRPAMVSVAVSEG